MTAKAIAGMVDIANVKRLEKVMVACVLVAMIWFRMRYGAEFHESMNHKS